MWMICKSMIDNLKPQANEYRGVKQWFKIWIKEHHTFIAVIYNSELKIRAKKNFNKIENVHLAIQNLITSPIFDQNRLNLSFNIYISAPDWHALFNLKPLYNYIFLMSKHTTTLLFARLALFIYFIWFLIDFFGVFFYGFHLWKLFYCVNTAFGLS